MKSIAHDKGESIFTLQKQPAEVFYIKKPLLKISQHLQENTSVEASFLAFRPATLLN